MKVTPLTLVSAINDITMLQAALMPLWMQWQQSGTPPTQAQIDAAAAGTDQGADLLAAAIERRRQREAAAASSTRSKPKEGTKP
jgi:hypothetical protein